jgi:hypothetical protein
VAITFVAAGAIAVGLTGADPAAPYPTGLQADDRLVLVVVNGPATEPGAQTGFTQQISGLSGTGAQSPGGAIYHKAATGSESGNFTVTNNTSATCRAIILAYRGVDTTTPIDVAATEASLGAVTAYTVGGQTASVTGVTFVGFTVSNSASGTMTEPTVPAAWAERLDSVANSPHLSVADLVAWSSSGASGDFNFVRSAAVRGYAAVIALRPAGGTNGTATPGVIALTSSMPAATLSGGGTGTPTAIATPVTMPAASAGASATTTPGTVAVAVSLPAATVTGGGRATPATVTLTVALPAPTLSAGQTTAPATIATTVTLPAVTTGAGSTASPAVIPITIDLPAAAASGSGGGGGTASPAVIACTATLPAATTSGGGTGSPATLPLSLTFPAASVSGAATASPSAIPVTLTTPTATTSGGGTATPSAIALVTAVPLPGVSAGTTVNPATIALAITLAAVVASGQGADENPITVTVQDSGHTVTATIQGTTTTARIVGTTETATEVGTTATTGRTYGTTTTAQEQT